MACKRSSVRSRLGPLLFYSHVAEKVTAHFAPKSSDGLGESTALLSRKAMLYYQSLPSGLSRTGIQVAATQLSAHILICPGIASGDSGKNTGVFFGCM